MKKAHTSEKQKKGHFNWYYNLLETMALKKSKKDELRGYPIDSYVLFRYIWSGYWVAFLTGFLVYAVPGAFIPVVGVWYGNALGLAGMEDTVTIAALYFVPYLFTVGFIFVGCIGLIKFVTNWFKKRNEFLIGIHFDLKSKETSQNND